MVALQGAMVGGVKAKFGGVDVVPLQGAIVVLGGRVTTNFGGADVVPLLCFGGAVTTNFGGVDVVPFLGAIAVCFGWGGG